MNQLWFREYVLLAFRIDKALRKFTNNPFVDYYYGPAEWKAHVEAETETSAVDLVRNAGALADSLPTQGFETHRTAYLTKQILAMETVCRKLSGQTFSLEDELQLCFDIDPIWIPESQFEQAWVLAEMLLPGEGRVVDRLHALKQRYELAREQSDLLMGFTRRALEEARRRTQTFVPLSAGEIVEVQVVTDKPYRAENCYHGNYRSTINMDMDLPANLASLLNLVCHEGYPGHHVELALKEQFLFQNRGYMEQSIGFSISPQTVISEGIAMLAYSMIFPPGEAQHWLVEHIYPKAGIKPIEIELEKVREVDRLLMGVQSNAVILLREGCSDGEVARYLARYLMLTEEASSALGFLKAPFHESYIFTYVAGKRLMEPWLQGTDRLTVFRRFLTEQFYPTELLMKEIPEETVQYGDHYTP